LGIDLSQVFSSGPLIAAMVALAGLFWGLLQYRQTGMDKRKEDFFQLAKEFDTTKEMYFAKKILDTWALDYSKSRGLFVSEGGPFNMHTINWILATGYSCKTAYEKLNPEFGKDKSDEEMFEAWQFLRDSFDTLFDFFERLTYLYLNNRVKHQELVYFSNYITAAIKNEDVKRFLTTWGYRWHNDLRLNAQSHKNT
jgi:hypothetical protein